MSGDITIRDFVSADERAVNDVAVTAWNQYRSAFDEWDGLAAFVANTAALASESELIVAERAGIVVGVVGYMAPLRPREPVFPSHWAIVRMLSVLPAARGRGVGRLLMTACIERGRRDGAPTIGLHTSPVMRSALDLYQRMGFVFIKAIPDRRGAPYAVYELSLSGN